MVTTLRQIVAVHYGRCPLDLPEAPGGRSGRHTLHQFGRFQRTALALTLTVMASLTAASSLPSLRLGGEVPGFPLTRCQTSLENVPFLSSLEMSPLHM